MYASVLSYLPYMLVVIMGGISYTILCMICGLYMILGVFKVATVLQVGTIIKQSGVARSAQSFTLL